MTFFITKAKLFFGNIGKQITFAYTIRLTTNKQLR